jgi:hypothetical protein
MGVQGATAKRKHSKTIQPRIIHLKSACEKVMDN